MIVTLTRKFELVAIIFLLLTIFISRIEFVSFHPDESSWIATSYYYEAFMNGEILSPVWNEQYFTLNQPPVTRYLIGLGRRIGGYQLFQLNSPWNFFANQETNINLGNMPNSDLLWWSRLPMAILSVLSLLILFFLVKKVAGRTAGYILLLLLVINSSLLEMLLRAMGEAPLLASVVLAAYAGYQALKHWEHIAMSRDRQSRIYLRSFFWLVMLGIFSGIASSSKLNGMATTLAGLGICALLPCIRGKNIINSERITFAITSAVFIVLAVGIVFISLNPYLYPDPLVRTRKMVEFRLTEIHKQTKNLPDDRISGIDERLRVIPFQILQRHASFRFTGAWVINIIFFSIGALYLLNNSLLWIRGKTNKYSSVIVMLFMLTVASPALLTPLNWERYFLLPIVFSTLCISIGIATAIRKLINWSERLPYFSK